MEKKTGKPAAAMMAGSAAILSVGIMHLFAETNGAVKTFLTFYQPMGALSGKVAISYAIAVVFYIVLQFLLKDKSPNPRTWLYVLMASLVIASIFVFTPFVKLLGA